MAKRKKEDAATRAEKKKKWLHNLLAGRADARLHPTALAQARLEKGLLQSQVAHICDLSLPTYCSIERGKRRATPATSYAIAETVGVPREALFNEVRPGAFVAVMPSGALSPNWKEI